MPVTSNRLITIQFSEDFSNVITAAASPNVDAPGAISLYSLVPGPNTITLPTGGTVVKGATIIPPEGNILELILKGVAGDTGIPLNLTDPSSISFSVDNIPTSIVIDAEDDIDGLRIVWS